MMRRTSTLPVAVYVYGCHYRGITGGAELAEDQYRKAHAYRERLVDIELDRRRQVREVLASGPDVAAPAAKLAAAEAEVVRLMTVAKAVRRASRSAVMSSDMSRDLKAARALVKDARQEHKAARRAAARDLGIKKRLDEAEQRCRDAVKEARGQSGLYWGTYLLLERGADQQRQGLMDPRHRPPGDGQIAVQIQKGMPVGKLADDPRLRMTMMESGPAPRSEAGKARPQLPGTMRSRGKHLELLQIRAGTVEGGRAPLWVEIPVVVHRPLPADARITWAALKRRREGRRWRYSLHVTVEAASLKRPEPLRQGSMVAVDLGWRMMRDDAGGLRVAAFRTDDGRGGEVRLSPRLLSGFSHAEEIQRVEENWFERARQWLLDWLDRPGKGLVPEEHLARLENLPLWRSAMRLSSFVWWWREHRFAGDSEIYGQMDDWRRRRFWHYRDWSRNERDRCIASRLDYFRVMANQILKGAAELVLEDFDLRHHARKPALGQEGPPAPVRRAMGLAAPGLLRQCLIQVARRQGTVVTEVDPRLTTIRCHACGSEAPWDKVPDVVHACAACKAVFDQDDNACRNMLAIAASGDGPGAGEAPEEGSDLTIAPGASS